MENIDHIFLSQKKFYLNNLIHEKLNYQITKLRLIRKWIKENEQEIIDNILKDYKKPITEIYTSEINPAISHIDYTIKNIKNWKKPKSVKTPIHLIGTKSKIYYEPKGVCLIISPWNYPFNLTLNPLVSAIAAGNCCIVKPSEYTPNTTLVISKMIENIFKKEHVCVFSGDHTMGNKLINLPFDHIFFTGSPEIGKKVMSAASKNLTSITLELGGKNHTIVDDSANLKDCAEKIIWTKALNCGQTCIACNHIFVSKNIANQLYIYLEKAILKLFPNGLKNNLDYGQIVNTKHLNRIKLILSNHLNKESSLENNVSKNRFIDISILKKVKLEDDILKEEIFGPLLPVVEYDNLNDIIKYIQKNEKPLAIYIFSNNKKNIDSILNTTSSGTSAINDCLIQYMNPNLPFGGVNTSGIGKSGGKRTFLNFTNEKSVLIQQSGSSIAKLFYPPYTNIKETLAKKLTWWL
ncbi:MAG: hypothetical protein CBC73_00540 [Flavobacteriales bacterium TMED113]|nr:MAG: hypothetical protein CBC73_00540 [Flavobacteriales bacterium TMED113]